MQKVIFKKKFKMNKNILLYKNINKTINLKIFIILSSLYMALLHF